MNRIFTVTTTRLGPIVLTARDGALTGAHFADQKVVPAAFNGAVRGDADPLLQRAARALQRYLDTGELEVGLPLCPIGTAFQSRVWSAIARIPVHETRTYRDIAHELGMREAVRAVGAATGRNPLCIFIPCHRVIGSDGTLTGYAGGLDRKRALLALEQRTGCLDLVGEP